MISLEVKHLSVFYYVRFFSSPKSDAFSLDAHFNTQWDNPYKLTLLVKCLNIFFLQWSGLKTRLIISLNITAYEYAYIIAYSSSSLKASTWFYQLWSLNKLVFILDSIYSFIYLFISVSARFLHNFNYLQQAIYLTVVSGKCKVPISRKKWSTFSYKEPWSVAEIDSDIDCIAEYAKEEIISHQSKNRWNLAVVFTFEIWLEFQWKYMKWLLPGDRSPKLERAANIWEIGHFV